MQIKLCVAMDPPSMLHPEKDTTFALLLEAQARQWELFITEPKYLFSENNQIYCLAYPIEVKDSQKDFIHIISSPLHLHLNQFNIILIRKDPPFDLNYLYATYLLEVAESKGAFIANSPRSIRDTNEKLSTLWLPHCCPETIVTSQKRNLIAFLEKHQAIVLKPLDRMGGQGIFLLNQGNLNINVTIEQLTKNETIPILAQRYLPEVMKGDKRILFINGKAYPYALTRIPAQGEFRANLAAGGKGIGTSLTDRDQWLCDQLAPFLKEKDLFFVGADIIGDYLTEINVTSPTGVREIEHFFTVNLRSVILDALIEKMLVHQEKAKYTQVP